MSMRPGTTTRPRASTVRSGAASIAAPTAAVPAGRGGEDLADVVGSDGQFAVAPVDENDELDALRAAAVDEGVHGRPDRPARHQEGVDEKDGLLGPAA